MTKVIVLVFKSAVFDLIVYTVCLHLSSPAILCNYHFICKILKFLPKLVLIQGHFQFLLRRVALLAAGLQLTLHGTEEVVHPVLTGLPGTLASGHPVQQLQG